MIVSSRSLPSRSGLLFLLIWISLSLVYAQEEETPVITQSWASRVIGFSYQYNAGTYSASQTLGIPNVYDRYGDIHGAWTHPRWRCTREPIQFIAVGYAEALNLTQVDIYETYHGGAVVNISARKPGGRWETVYHNDAPTIVITSRIFSPALQALSCKIDALRIEVNCFVNRYNKYVEIDAIQIHGYKGCFQRKWGLCCANNCGNCWNDTICDGVNGICPKIGENFICAAGYRTEKCDTDCDSGTYGYDCLDTCGNCASGFDKCAKITGECPITDPRCAPGFKGDLCKQNCTFGHYGTDCSQECGYCAGKPEACSTTTGNCSGSPACLPGYTGILCKTVCPPFSYGIGCNETCGACKSGTCQPTNGHCPPDDCEAGRRGRLCKQECANGTWGEDCRNDCGNCKLGLNSCGIYNGSCAEGCLAGFEGSTCETKSSIESDPEAGGSGAIIGGVVAAVVLVLIVLVVVIFLVKRRRASKTEREEHSVAPEDRYVTPPRTVLEDGYSAPPNTGQRGRDGEYYNVVDFQDGPSSVPVDELESYLRNKRTENKLTAEYESLPKGLQAHCEVAKKPENKGKSRYQNIVAYDHSRVVLDPLEDDPDSDYINACYIHGYKEDKKYVASQGPTGVIVNDFWRTIWQLNTGKVVMLTNLVEDGKKKSELYWPVAVSDTSEFGLISVSLFDEEVFADFTVRILHVKNKKHPGQTKEIKQFHFTAWPDHGVPTHATGLLNFRDKVNNSTSKLNGPVFIHCSAGIGRTGTFIGLDFLIRQANQDGVVDVPACVRLMRQQRTNMIQTVGQYEFLYEALIEAIKLSNCSIPSVDFSSVYCDLCVANPNTGQTKLQKQFKALNDLSPALKTTDVKSATDPVNLPKSRNPTILAADNGRPFLSTPVSGCNDYINAVFLPAYKRKRAFIITQMPLPGTVVDFWRLIHEQDVRTVIMLDTVHTTRNDVGTYWPKTSAQYGPFDVETVEVEGGDSFVTRILRFQYKKEAQRDNANVKQFQCTFWQEDTKVPDSSGPLITLIEEVERWQQQSGNAPIIVHCLDGATKSGLYCALSSIIERLKVDQEVNILQTIKQMRINRPEIVDNLSYHDVATWNHPAMLSSCCLFEAKEAKQELDVDVNSHSRSGDRRKLPINQIRTIQMPNNA